jgi:hypothetical protein
MRPSFTVSGLMAAVVVVALGLVALRDPGPLTASLVYSLAVAILVVAGILGCARRGRSRAGWLTMALAGAAYLHFAFVGRDPEPPPLITSAALAGVIDRLTGEVGKTTRVFTRGKTTITVVTGSSFGGGGVHVTGTGTMMARGTGSRRGGTGATATGSSNASTGVQTMTYHLPDPDPTSFVEPRGLSLGLRYARGQVGQSLMAILVGLLGGLAGRRLAERDDPAPI